MEELFIYRLFWCDNIGYRDSFLSDFSVVRITGEGLFLGSGVAKAKMGIFWTVICVDTAGFGVLCRSLSSCIAVLP